MKDKVAIFFKCNIRKSTAKKMNMLADILYIPQQQLVALKSQNPIKAAVS